MWGVAFMDWTGSSSTSHRCLVGLRSGEYGGYTLNSLSCSWKHSWTMSAVLQEASSYWTWTIRDPVAIKGHFTRSSSWCGNSHALSRLHDDQVTFFWCSRFHCRCFWDKSVIRGNILKCLHSALDSVRGQSTCQHLKCLSAALGKTMIEEWALMVRRVYGVGLHWFIIYAGVSFIVMVWIPFGVRVRNV